MNLIMMIFLFLWNFHAYCKWKYPEEYCDWEGESVEDWYGKKYLKKHKGMYKWKSWNNKIKKHLSLTSDASLMVIVFRMNQIKDVTDIFSIICDKLQE